MRKILQFMLLCSAPLAAQSTGTVRGRVTDQGSQAPLSGVSVSVGTRATLTGADGNYTMTGVAAGSYTLRVRMIGYARSEQPITVEDGGTTVTDVALTGQAVGLSAVVVTGYGQQRVG